MNFNYILSTGAVSISGSESDILHRNHSSFLIKPSDTTSNPLVVNLTSKGQKKTDTFSVDTDVITGDHSTLLSLNSQTLLEGDETINISQRWNYYTLGSGDYFVDFDSGGDLFHFSSGLSLTSNDVVSYDKRDFSTGVMVYKSSSESVSTTLSNLISKAESIHFDASNELEFFTNYDLFVNGQKAYSSSELPTSSSITGKFFAIHKKDNITEVFSTEPDVYGSGYIDYQFDFYLNGMRQSVADVLQLYTGVYMVETGINSSLGKFDLTTSNTYNL